MISLVRPPHTRSETTMKNFTKIDLEIQILDEMLEVMLENSSTDPGEIEIIETKIAALEAQR
jgi:hypothetical protein